MGVPYDSRMVIKSRKAGVKAVNWKITENLNRKPELYNRSGLKLFLSYRNRNSWGRK